jgi:chemotaxis protein MotA
MFKAMFSNGATTEELQVGVKGWKMARIYVLASGVIGLLIGAVIMLKNMSDPAAIGPAMAVALLTIFYGFVLSFGIYLPLQSCLEDRIEEQASAS